MVKVMAVLMATLLMLVSALVQANASLHWHAWVADRSGDGVLTRLVAAGDDNGARVR